MEFTINLSPNVLEFAGESCLDFILLGFVRWWFFKSAIPSVFINWNSYIQKKFPHHLLDYSERQNKYFFPQSYHFSKVIN